MHALTRAGFALLALSAACAGGSDRSFAPSYYADVAPRIERSCLSCHASTNEGRPNLGSLDAARMHAQEMLVAVEHGLMPPGGIDRSGSCGTFLGPAPFTAGDVHVLREWLDAGMPEGTPRALPPDVNEDTARFDRSLDLSFPLAPDATDEHRCYLVETGLDTETHLEGAAVSSEPALHHAMIFALPGSSIAEALALDATDTAPGWACPGSPLVSSRLLFAWVPGTQVSTFPNGAGVLFPPGPLVVQIHQHGPSVQPNAQISLFLADQVEHELTMLPIAATGFELSAGVAEVKIERTVLLARERDALVFGVMPHLHAAGRAVTLSAEGGPCLVDAPHYDFAWQEMAFYEAPVRVAAGAPIALSCTWDTRDRTANVHWGESSDDEMCTVFLFATDVPGPAPSANALRSATSQSPAAR